jgi:hypothetical protein
VTRRVLALCSAVAALVLLGVAGIAARSGGYAAPAGQRPVDLSSLPDIARAPANPTTLGRSATPTPGQVHEAAGPGVELLVLAAAVGGLVLVLLLALLLRRIGRWPGRAAAPVAVVPAAAGPPPASMAEAVREALVVVEQPGAREAVVRSWLLLGRAAAEAGTPPRPADTAAEYGARVAAEQGLDPTALGRLAALYREARFSTHPVGEAERAEARAVLESLRAELAGAR